MAAPSTFLPVLIERINWATANYGAQDTRLMLALLCKRILDAGAFALSLCALVPQSDLDPYYTLGFSKISAANSPIGVLVMESQATYNLMCSVYSSDAIPRRLKDVRLFPARRAPPVEQDQPRKPGRIPREGQDVAVVRRQFGNLFKPQGGRGGRGGKGPAVPPPLPPTS
jgi:hypothetical protein